MNLQDYDSGMKAELLARLLWIRAQAEALLSGEKVAPEFREYAGICMNLEVDYCTGLYHASQDLRHDLFEAWPEFSGNGMYPVPGGGWLDYNDYELSWDCDELTYEEADAAYAFEEGFSCMWGDDSYGASRRRLLQFCIDTLIADGVSVPATEG